MLYILRASCKKLVLSFHNLYLVGLKYHLFKFTVESFNMRYPTILGNGLSWGKILAHSNVEIYAKINNNVVDSLEVIK